MATNTEKAKRIKLGLIIMPIAIAILLGIHIGYIAHFNSVSHTVKSGESDSPVYMEIAGRSGDTNTWKKRDFDYNGQTVDLWAQTIDGTIYNNSDYEVKEWSFTLNIQGDCYLNQTWNGQMEIHQNVDGEERVQTLNLGDYDENDITLNYQISDGDLLIPLSKGDYIVYLPNTEVNEMPMDKDTSVTMGFILYYLDDPDLSQFDVTYTYNRGLVDGPLFYVVVVLGIIWAILLLIYIVWITTYRRTVREMQMKRDGIVSMSAIYAIIYAIDLEQMTLQPIVADEESEKLRPKDMNANEQLQNLCNFDIEEPYREMAIEFCELTTLADRMATKDTLVFEYVSKSYGWCRIRFFAMERDEEGELKVAIYTIQEINDEKKELEIVEGRVNEAEKESKAKSVFLANMSHEIRTPINTVLGLDTMILRECKDPAIKSYARDIKSAANMLLSLINGILDFSKLEADKMELVPAEYSFKQLIYDVRNLVKSRVEFEHLDFQVEVQEQLPDQLYGDNVRIKQVLINLLTNAAKYTEEGSVKLTVFGKQTEDNVHLLISVKDTGIGIHDEDLEKLTERFTRVDEKKNRNIEGTGIGLNLVTGILDLMDSELHIISKYGEGSEFYFEIEQKVVGDQPVGELDFEAAQAEEEEAYSALFTAPNAHVLVVDDNGMNLTVFESLLKETQLQIDKANSGAMALSKTEKNPYDLIFMDHMMPEMDGIEAFHKLREQKNGKNKKTPVVILTANAIKGVEDQYRKEGFDGYLSKPIDPEQLEKTIIEYVDPKKVQLSKNKKAKASNKEEKEIKLPVIEGMDTSYGVEHTGGIVSLISVMKQFAGMYQADRDELMGYFGAIEENHENREAIKNYRIKVHAMKSSANVLGALRLSGLAATLEDGAQHEDVEEILTVTPYLIKAWEKYGAAVSDYIKENQGPKEADQQELQKMDQATEDALLHQLETGINMYDIKSCDAVIKQLKEHGWSQEETEIIDQLEVAVTNLNAEEAVKLCSQLKEINK